VPLGVAAGRVTNPTAGERPVADETTIPLLPCVSLDETLDFYRALGFEVTHEQDWPYVYGAVRRGGLDLHFFRPKGRSPTKAAGTCLVMVPEVGPTYQAFALALRGKYGKLPTAESPRISRLRKGQCRFNLVDPAGNSLIFIGQDDSYEYPESEEWSRMPPLVKALETAANLRDMQWDDAAAAKVLDVALARNPDAPAVERARALAARAELAVALGDAERLAAVRAELQKVPLSDEDRERIRAEVQAADDLERWRG
jgi:catechol 2,3-dioxygenase-like lactoylglutathione lyase family enzyme